MSFVHVKGWIPPISSLFFSLFLLIISFFFIFFFLSSLSLKCPKVFINLVIQKIFLLKQIKRGSNNICCRRGKCIEILHCSVGRKQVGKEKKKKQQCLTPCELKACTTTEFRMFKATNSHAASRRVHEGSNHLDRGALPMVQT